MYGIGTGRADYKREEVIYKEQLYVFKMDATIKGNRVVDYWRMAQCMGDLVGVNSEWHQNCVLCVNKQKPEANR